MDRKALFNQIKHKQSFLCVGLDTDINKIPGHLKKAQDPVFEFNKAIIDATLPFTVAYKCNTAFYEAMGEKGWKSLRKTFEYLPNEVFTIADAKRGDIGNTSSMYARAFFDPQAAGVSFDAITVAPYMGKDSVSPFLSFDKKWVILLALTSNQGSADFQHLQTTRGSYLFEEVLQTSKQWGTSENLMYVIGATQAEKIVQIRKLIPDHFLLVPGVGAQGGSLAKVAEFGMIKDCGLLVNASRSIIYASNDENFANAANYEAVKIQQAMQVLLEKLL